MGVGQPSPSMLPLKAMAAAAEHRLGSPNAELLLQYGPRQGYHSFRRSLAAFLSERYGTPVDPEHLMITAGVSHGLDLAVRALSRPGDVIVVECPTYFLVAPIFADSRLRTVPMPTDEQGLVVEELERWLRADEGNRPRLLYTIPIHNNPRGTTLTPTRRRALMRLAAEFDFTVLADEVYQVLSFPEDKVADDGSCDEGAAVPRREPLPLPLRCYEQQGEDGGNVSGEDGGRSHAGNDAGVRSDSEGAQNDPRVGQGIGRVAGRAASRVVSLGSFSKMLAPALRLGWIESSDPELLRRCRDNGVISSGGCIAQIATGLAHSALELGLQASHLDCVVRPGLASRCRALLRALVAHLPPGCCEGLVQPRGGYFVWLQLPAQVDSRVLLTLAESRHRVRFTPGPACGGGGAHCIRLCFAFYSEQELEEGARRLGAAVREYLQGCQEGTQGTETSHEREAGQHVEQNTGRMQRIKGADADNAGGPALANAANGARDVARGAC